MERFRENFRGGRESILCPLCGRHKDNQESSFTSCRFIQEKINIKGQFNNIFEKAIEKETITTISKITRIRHEHTDEKWHQKEQSF